MQTLRPTRLTAAVAALALALALALAASAASAPAAHAKVSVGIGQQTPEMFGSPFWKRLNLPNVRYIAPYDTINDPVQLAKLDVWMAGARAANASVMIGFRSSLRSAAAARHLPSPRAYTKAFRALRKRYPEVRDWIPWNETNHPTALTGPRPKRAAQYYNAVVKNCRGCNVVGGDVLDISNMESWLRRYQRYTKPRPHIWGLHNYHDANSRVSTGVRRLLRAVKGTIWMTETGGVVRMRVGSGRTLQKRNYGLKKAAGATKHVLNLSRISKRIGRIYLYHWSAPFRFTTWDSALMTPTQRPRRAYNTLVKWLRGARRSGLAR